MTPTIRKTLLSLLTAAVAAYAVVHLSGPSGVAALLEKRAEIKAMQDENQRLEQKVGEKTQYVEDIKSKKPEVIIPLIRNKTNWVREGEKDFRFEKQSATPDRSR
jgi:cell division protein FtsB